MDAETNDARERAATYGETKNLSDADLIALVSGKRIRVENLLDLSWAKVGQIMQDLETTETQAVRLAAAFELGRRAGWTPPTRGERCLDPGRVADLMRPAARKDVECFWLIMLDVRGRLLRTVKVAEGSLTQCPVSPRDTLRPAIREGAHSVIFVHNHPSGDPSPSPEDQDLTERLRGACEIMGVVARDHVIVAAGGYYSFVEAGRWRR
jgi:DNA repair protein RadC